eukprot:8668078-Pyramimonas_sp.AAC.1
MRGRVSRLLLAVARVQHCVGCPRLSQPQPRVIVIAPASCTLSIGRPLSYVLAARAVALLCRVVPC